MLRNKKLTRIIALFFIIEMLADIALPYAAFALTSGPTAPEATSFEPVDTTDMVNLATGDLVYNLPLLEVPGPAGGYPISLSYHAGIRPGQEASWVGLGWTLNPGAITREVSGHADDIKDAQKVDRFFWNGGKTQTAEIGLTYGIAGTPGSVTAGLSVSHDTYQGMGVGGFVRLSTSMMQNSNLGVGGSLTVGVSPYGGAYASAGIGLGISSSEKSAASLSVGVNVSTNFESVNAGASGGISVSHNDKNAKTGQGGIGAGSASVLGASISSSNNGGASVSAGGATYSNRRNGKISTKHFGFTLPIPFVHLGYNYQRYWMDETDVSQAHGLLHLPTETKDRSYFNNNDHDTYSLLDPTVEGGIVDQPDPDRVIGGTFPDFDHFSVNAQGLGGSFKPFLGEVYLDKLNDGNDLVNKQLGVNKQDVSFRFIGGFSNSYDFNESELDESRSNFTYSFDEGTRTAGEGADGFGYDESTNRLADSRHIEYFTNDQINLGLAQTSGLRNTKSTGFTRAENDQIGAFMITNESGVTYHFSLPAYTKYEYQYSGNKDFSHGKSFNERLNYKPYAYTWYLTAVTGPDYVDRNNDGIANSGDWGYWVELDYGLWAPNFYWRNPGEGFNNNIDSEFQDYAEGYKQVYYLDAIRTETHQAIFVKEVRNDAKSAINDSWFEESDTKFEGGYYPRNLRIEKDWYGENTDGEWVVNEYKDALERPTCSLKLNKIVLMKANVENSKVLGEHGIDYVKNLPGIWSEYNSAKIRVPSRYFYSLGRFENLLEYHKPEYVIDIADYNQDKSSITEATIREIEFNTDYSLVPNTPNSYPTNLLTSGAVSTDKSLYESNYTGKLTLKSLINKGKKGNNNIPPMNFEYSDNPEYNKDAFDIWGFYKSDVNKNKLSINEDLARKVNPGKSDDVMAWSLRKILTPLGSEIAINYESDTYNEIGMTDNLAIRIKNFEYLGDGEFNLSLYDDIDQVSEVTPEMSLLLSMGFYYSADQFIGVENCTNDIDDCEIDYTPGRYYSSNTSSNVISIDKSTNSIIVQDTELEELLLTDKTYENSKISFWCGPGNRIWVVTKCDLLYSGMPITIGGIMTIPIDSEIPGGGLRVKSIKVNTSNIEKTTNYYYYNGVTSYEPFGIPAPLLAEDYPDNYSITWGKNKIKAAMLGFYNDLIVNSRELPPPGVVYKKAHIEEEINGNKLPAYSVYEFQTFEKEMVSLKPEGAEIDKDVRSTDDGLPVYEGLTYERLRARKISKKDYSARIGALKKVKLLDFNDNPISETNYHYLYQQQGNFESELINQFSNQGFTQETYAHASLSMVELESGNQSRQMLGVVTKHERYPLIQVGQTDKNYKTGVTTTTRNLEFDFFSGAVTKDLSKDSYGNYFVSESIPAYKKYPEMGLGMYGAANMLTQEAANTIISLERGDDNHVITLSPPDVLPSKRWRIIDINENLNINDILSISLGGKEYTFQLAETVSEVGNEHFYIDWITESPQISSTLSSVSSSRLKSKLNSAAVQTWNRKSNLLDKFHGSFEIERQFSVGDNVQNFKVNPPNVRLEVGDQVGFNIFYKGAYFKGKVVEVLSDSYNIWVPLLNGGGINFSSSPTHNVFVLSAPSKHRSYSFIGDPSVSLTEDGLYPIGNFSEFNAWSPNQEPPSTWQKNSEITLYDVYSHALEATDVNGNYAATKFDSKQEQVYATVANANYNEFAYSGAEDELINSHFGGGVEIGAANRVHKSNSPVHSGSYAMQVGDKGGEAFYYLFPEAVDRNRTYRLSVWVHQDTKTSLNLVVTDGATEIASLKGSEIPETRKAGEWYLANLDVSLKGSTGQIKFSCNAGNSYDLVVDDFRFHPVDAAMTSYVYNEFGELTHILDANNIYTRYKYDAMGRLTKTYRETFQHGELKTSQTVYKYFGQ